MDDDTEEFNYNEDANLGVDALTSQLPDGAVGGSYSREDLINAQELRTSQFRIIALQEFKELDASMELKQAYGRWTNTYFTLDMLLANNSVRKEGDGFLFKRDRLGEALSSADLELDKCAITSCHFDTLQPWCGSI